VLERYFEGEDEARGRRLGKVSFTGATLHDMRSVSKSVVGLLYGIALEQRKVPRSTTAVVPTAEFWHFGYHWYMGDVAFGPRLERCWGAFGNGGQRLWVLPALHIAVAITAGNYNTTDQWLPPTRVLREVVLASLT
jgi:CubicO group peptidase (beta-lactamase class C family)